MCPVIIFCSSVDDDGGARKLFVNVKSWAGSSIFEPSLSIQEETLGQTLEHLGIR